MTIATLTSEKDQLQSQLKTLQEQVLELEQQNKL